MATESQNDSRIQIWLDADVVVDSAHWAAIDDVEDSVAAASRAMALHAQFEGSASAVVCISLSSDEVVRDLNRTYRNMDKPTNVLSFPAGNGAYFQREVRPLGDIVLAAETLFREAAELNVSPRHHMQHLVVHGLLHLSGFDHDADEDAVEMEGLEVEILSSLGIANPYARETGDGPLRERLA